MDDMIIRHYNDSNLIKRSKLLPSITQIHRERIFIPTTLV